MYPRFRVLHGVDVGKTAPLVYVDDLRCFAPESGRLRTYTYMYSSVVLSLIAIGRALAIFWSSAIEQDKDESLRDDGPARPISPSAHLG